MNTVIWKYPMPLEEFSNERNSTKVDLREGFEILSIQLQDGVPTIWVEVNPKAPVDRVEIAIAGTGSALPPEPRDFIGTVQTPPFVWHFYAVWEKQ